MQTLTVALNLNPPEVPLTFALFPCSSLPPAVAVAFVWLSALTLRASLSQPPPPFFRHFLLCLSRRVFGVYASSSSPSSTAATSPSVFLNFGVHPSGLWRTPQWGILFSQNTNLTQGDFIPTFWNPWFIDVCFILGFCFFLRSTGSVGCLLSCLQNLMVKSLVFESFNDFYSVIYERATDVCKYNHFF